jgi:hypothetical protein
MAVKDRHLKGMKLIFSSIKLVGRVQWVLSGGTGVITFAVSVSLALGRRSITAPFVSRALTSSPCRVVGLVALVDAIHGRYRG